jgi:hypothetical protein
MVNALTEQLQVCIAGLHPQTPCHFTTFSASLRNLTVLLHQSHDYSYYVSRRTLAPPLTAETGAHDFAHSHDLWQQPRLTKVTCTSSWRHCGINPAIIVQTVPFPLNASRKTYLVQAAQGTLTWWGKSMGNSGSIIFGRNKLRSLSWEMGHRHEI